MIAGVGTGAGVGVGCPSLSKSGNCHPEAIVASATATTVMLMHRVPAFHLTPRRRRMAGKHTWAACRCNAPTGVRALGVAVAFIARAGGARYPVGMRALEVVAHGDLDPTRAHALDVTYQHRARHANAFILRGYRLAGAVLSLGRFHLTPSGDPGGAVALHRRLGGGRPLPLGPAFALLSLAMPHRSALVADEPLALRPEQVLNRCVRALLAGLRALRIDAYYPGRDVLTIDGRIAALVSLDVAGSGATTFESVLACEDGWRQLGDFLDAADREGAITAELLDDDRVTSLSTATASLPSPDELVHVIGSALAAQFGFTPEATAPLSVGDEAPAGAAAWIESRRLRPGLVGHAVQHTQIGTLDVHVRTRAGMVDDVMLAGDFIADAEGIEHLEQSLRGCPVDTGRLVTVLDRVYADRSRFLLGVGRHEVIAEAICRAARGAG